MVVSKMKIKGSFGKSFKFSTSLICFSGPNNVIAQGWVPSIFHFNIEILTLCKGNQRELINQYLIIDNFRFGLGFKSMMMMGWVRLGLGTSLVIELQKVEAKKLQSQPQESSFQGPIFYLLFVPLQNFLLLTPPSLFHFFPSFFSFFRFWMQIACKI